MHHHADVVPTPLLPLLLGVVVNTSVVALLHCFLFLSVVPPPEGIVST